MAPVHRRLPAMPSRDAFPLEQGHHLAERRTAEPELLLPRNGVTRVRD
jgi:hypothetical protein